MQKRVRRHFSDEQKRKAVDDFVSGRKSAEQVAAENDVSSGMIYKWRVQLDEQAKGVRIDELQSQGTRPEDARRIQELENELDEYKKQLAEKTVIAELLKKRLQSKNSQQRSELTGLIETLELAARKRKPVK